MFTLGIGQVIEGFDQGVTGMKVGGARRIVIPPSLGYGSPRNNSIPAFATLVFDVELVEVIEPPAYAESLASPAHSGQPSLPADVNADADEDRLRAIVDRAIRCSSVASPFIFAKSSSPKIASFGLTQTSAPPPYTQFQPLVCISILCEASPIVWLVDVRRLVIVHAALAVEPDRTGLHARLADDVPDVGVHLGVERESVAADRLDLAADGR